VRTKGCVHGAAAKSEYVLPWGGIGCAGSADTDNSSGGIVVVIVAESGLIDLELGAAGGAEAD